MKRSMGGGSARGPVAHSRQRRTIRFMQSLLVIAGVLLLLYAVTALMEVARYEQSDAVDAGAPPGIMQPIALAAAAVLSFVVARLLGGRDGVNLPTPARLEEFAGRADKAAAERNEAVEAEPAAPVRDALHSDVPARSSRS